MGVASYQYCAGTCPTVCLSSSSFIEQPVYATDRSPESFFVTPVNPPHRFSCHNSVVHPMVCSATCLSLLKNDSTWKLSSKTFFSAKGSAVMINVEASAERHKSTKSDKSGHAGPKMANGVASTSCCQIIAKRKAGHSLWQQRLKSRAAIRAILAKTSY